MAMLIKKQLLKHLSKFANNLSPDKINLSTLRGEGELSNLEFNCEALQNLLNLPTWLKIDHAICNKVTVKIPFTKLGTTPITIILDSVDLEMSTCEVPRPPNGPSPIQDSASGDTSYGSIQRILEGIAVRIDSINVQFTSTAFVANFQLSQLLVFSTDPKGNNCDLRTTRIQNKPLKQVLTFKKVTWQTMRIELRTLDNTSHNNTTRLITNKASLFITLRRKTTDLSLIASRLILSLDDVQWVFTVAQVHASMLCVKSIFDIIKNSMKHERKLEKKELSFQEQNKAPVANSTGFNSMLGFVKSDNDINFNKNLIYESSFHFDLEKINLVIADDGTLKQHQKLGCSKLVDDGALLMNINKVSLDIFPMHKSGQARSHFRNYGEINESRDKWAEEILMKFKHDYTVLKNITNFKKTGSSSKLHERCTNLKIGNIEIEQVTSPSVKVEKCHDKLIYCDRNGLHLPDSLPFVSVQLTDYFYPDLSDFPAPHANLMMKITAPLLTVNFTTLNWLSQLIISTVNSVQDMLTHLGFDASVDANKEQTNVHTDIRLECIMPKVIIPSCDELKSFKSLEYNSKYEKLIPDGLQLQISELTITNNRNGKNCSMRYLQSLLDKLKNSTLYSSFSNEFPNKESDDIIKAKYFEEIHEKKTILINGNKENIKFNSKTLQESASNDLFSIFIRQLWLDFMHIPTTSCEVDGEKFKHGGFISSPSKRDKTKYDVVLEGLIDSFPINLWMTKNYDDRVGEVINILAGSEKKLQIKIEHFQFIYLLKLIENIQNETENLQKDAEKLMKLQETSAVTVNIWAYFDKAQVFVQFPDDSNLPTDEKSSNNHHQNSTSPSEFITSSESMTSLSSVGTSKQSSYDVISLKSNLESFTTQSDASKDFDTISIFTTDDIIPPQQIIPSNLSQLPTRSSTFPQVNQQVPAHNNTTSGSIDKISTSNLNESSQAPLEVTDDISTSHNNNNNDNVTSPSSSQEKGDVTQCNSNEKNNIPKTLQNNHHNEKIIPEEDNILKSKEVKSFNQIVCIQADDSIQLNMQIKPTISSVKLVTPFLKIIELGRVCKKKNLFTSMSIRTKLKNLEEENQPTKDKFKCSHLKLRMNIDSVNEILDKNLELKVNGLEQQLNATTLTRLGEFFEDDSEPELFPMKIEAQNIKFSINPDTPPVYLPFSSVKDQNKVCLVVHKISLERKKDDPTFYICPPSKEDKSNTVSSNNQLEEQKHEWRKSLEEEISELKRERNSLYQTINILQDDLMKSEEEKKKFKNKIESKT